MAKRLFIKLKDSNLLIYKNIINSEDYKIVAIILSDLQSNGVNIEKAYKEFSKQNEKKFPW